MSCQIKNPFVETKEEKVKKWILQEVMKSSKAEKDAAEAKIAAEAESQEAKAEEDLLIMKAKQTKTKEETILFKQAVNDVFNLIVEEWNKEDEKRKDESLKPFPNELLLILLELQQKLLADIDALKQSYLQDMIKYKWSLTTLNPLDQTTIEETWNSVVTLARDKFDKAKKEKQELLKKMQELRKKLSQSFQFDLDSKISFDKINQKIAEIPLTIEDKIQEIRDIFDMLLGKFLPPEQNPEDWNFDVNKVIGQVMEVINPVLESIAPIEGLAGKVPILGDLASMLQMLSVASGDKKLSKEEIKKRIGEMIPDVPKDIEPKIWDILQDIWIMIATISTMFVDVIFQMIDAIIGMFKEIAGIIGVPEIPYPLSLVPTCISLMPKVKLLIKKLPKFIWAAVWGTLKQKYAEIMALSFPMPNIEIPEIEDGEAEKPSCCSKPETKKIDYNDVINEKLPCVSPAGYDRTDLTRVLKSYKKIHNGSCANINKYIDVTGESSKENLSPIKTSACRKEGTPEGFKAVLDEVFSGDISKFVEYDAYKRTESVVGALYNRYASKIKGLEPNEEMVVKEVIEP